LPIEFSRISGWRKAPYLSLVVDPRDGVLTQIRFALSIRSVLNETIEDVRRREGTNRDKIGFVDLRSGGSHSRLSTIVATLTTWARDQGLHAVVWTDLEPNFLDILERPFTPQEGLAFLSSRTGDSLKTAREYLLKAPPEVDTPVRRLARESGWLTAAPSRDTPESKDD
jgi:hypothetical protein